MDEWLTYAGKLILFILSALGVYKYAKAGTDRRLEALEKFKDEYASISAKLSSIELAQKKYEEAQKKYQENQTEMKEMHERDQRIATEKMAEAIHLLRDTIRNEFDRAVEKINKLLFEEGGSSRYLPRGEHDRLQDNCRSDIIRRIEKIEMKLP